MAVRVLYLAQCIPVNMLTSLSEGFFPSAPLPGGKPLPDIHGSPMGLSL